MNSKDNAIFQHIEQEKRILWGSFDEVVPVLAIAPILFLCHAPYVGMVFAIGWTLLIKRLKKGHGAKYLAVILYGCAPSLCLKNKKTGKQYVGILRNTPPSERLHWI